MLRLARYSANYARQLKHARTSPRSLAQAGFLAQAHAHAHSLQPTPCALDVTEAACHPSACPPASSNSSQEVKHNACLSGWREHQLSDVQGSAGSGRQMNALQAAGLAIIRSATRKSTQDFITTEPPEWQDLSEAPPVLKIDDLHFALRNDEGFTQTTSLPVTTASTDIKSEFDYFDDDHTYGPGPSVFRVRFATPLPLGLHTFAQIATLEVCNPELSYQGDFTLAVRLYEGDENYKVSNPEFWLLSTSHSYEEEDRLTLPPPTVTEPTHEPTHPHRITWLYQPDHSRVPRLRFSAAMLSPLNTAEDAPLPLHCSFMRTITDRFEVFEYE